MNTNTNKKASDLFWACNNCRYRATLNYSDWGCFDGDCPAQGFSFHDPIRTLDKIKADIDVVNNCSSKSTCILMAEDTNVCHFADLCKGGHYNR